MNPLLVVTLVAAIDPGAAQQAFAELAAMCAADGGRLWGRSVCGPAMFADPQTREAVTSEGSTVTLPQSIGIANTAVEWEGRRWTMVMWPLPKDVIARRTLLAHESFHRIQNELGLRQTEASNAHLESADGRHWMRLEWRALARALATRDSDAVADALAFRARRRELAGAAREHERGLEINEGLAEHTGAALAVRNVEERLPFLLRKLAAAEKQENFARSFAYTSGPAWGALIEMRDPRWTRKVKPADDLGALAARAWKVSPAAELRASSYGGAAVRAEEDAREARMVAERAALRVKFVEGPVLVLPLREMQFVMDPNFVQPLDDLGSVYRTLTVTDRWGTLSTKDGALVSADFTRLIVPAAGEPWTLKLNEGWRVVDGPRAGDKTVAK